MTSRDIEKPPRMDPDVVRELARMRGDGPRPEPPGRGDVLTRRLNARWTAEHAMVLRPSDAGIDIQAHSLVTDDGAALRLVWYRCAGAEQPGSAVLYLHGGGMIYDLGVLGKLYDSAVRTYVAQSGVPMLLVDYRVAPEHRYPVPLEDSYAALLWLVAQDGELGVDPARIAVMGDSAGGGLAVALCLLSRDRGGPPIAQQLLLSPMLDDRMGVVDPGLSPFLTWSYDDNATAWAAFLGDLPGGAEVPAYAAPARAAELRGLPPAYIDVGELDIFCAENVAYADRLEQAGIPVELCVYPGCPHSFEWLAPGAGVSRRAVAGRVRRLRSL